MTLGLCFAGAAADTTGTTAGVPVVTAHVLSALLEEEDTDGDLRITVLDPPLRGHLNLLHPPEWLFERPEGVPTR